MSSGVSRVHVGAVTGTGAALEVRKAGFRPSYVKVFNVSADNAAGEWLEGMADDSAFKTITDGTVSVITSDGITPLSDGFSIGADADLNVDGELIRYVCFE
jgi:hypothetical protein